MLSLGRQFIAVSIPCPSKCSLSGSGKSYVAKSLRDVEVMNGGAPPRIFSLDDYFLVEDDEVLLPFCLTVSPTPVRLNFSLLPCMADGRMMATAGPAIGTGRGRHPVQR